MSTAQRYNLAWNYIWENYGGWKKSIITEEPDGRHAQEFTKDIIALAESDKDIPVIKSNYKIDEPIVSGTK